MKVFITGAAGFIGQATVSELLSHGHTVLGLARSDANASILESLGASVQRGDLENLDSLRAGAAASDGVIHLGFVHDFTRFEEVCAIDRGAIQALAEGLGKGSGKPLLIASGTLGLEKVDVANEDTKDNLGLGPLSARAKSSALIRELSRPVGEGEGMGIRGMVIRFSPNVHGKGDKGFANAVILAAQKNGKSIYIEGSDAVWPEAHRLDTAVLLRLAVEKGRAGATYNAIDEEGVKIKEFADLVGRKLNVPVEGVTTEEAQKLLGFLAFPWGAKNYVSSEKTRKELGWKPTQKGWLEDVEEHYFTEEALNSGKGFNY